MMDDAAPIAEFGVGLQSRPGNVGNLSFNQWAKGRSQLTSKPIPQPIPCPLDDEPIPELPAPPQPSNGQSKDCVYGTKNRNMLTSSRCRLGHGESCESLQ